MSLTFVKKAALAAGILTLAASAGAYAADQQLTGAGSTAIYPVLAAWSDTYHKDTGIALNYQAIGSGGGQNQILKRTVDFGASDAPMVPEKLESGKLLQFPTVMGSVVVIVNIPGIEANQLKLPGDVLADVYEGKITKWNDPRIAEANAGVKLPSLAIAPVYRADGSGTSFVYTSYLSAVSPSWKDKVGANTSVKWPAGAGAKGNDGVAATVHNTRGGIGYVEYAYASQNHLVTVQLRNKAGHFVAPTLEAFTDAAAHGDWANAKNFAVNLIDQPGDKTWPIVSATFIELPKDPADPARSAAVMKFFDWAYKNGDASATALDYIPLPEAVKAAVRSAWHAEVLTSAGKPVL
jgi:phosphate transport system substrate-binding protein